MYIKTDRNVALYLCFLFQPFYPLPPPPNTKGQYHWILWILFYTSEYQNANRGRCGRDRMYGSWVYNYPCNQDKTKQDLYSHKP